MSDMNLACSVFALCLGQTNQLGSETAALLCEIVLSLLQTSRFTTRCRYGFRL